MVLEQHFLGFVKNFLEPFRGHQRLTHVREEASQVAYRPEQHPSIGAEQHHGADGDLPPGGEIGAGHQGQTDLEKGQEVTGTPIAGQKPDQMVNLIPVHFVLGQKALDLILLVGKCPNHPDAREILLEHRGELRLRFIHFPEGCPHFAEKHRRGNEQNGHYQHGDEGHAHIGAEHDGADQQYQGQRVPHFHQLYA